LTFIILQLEVGIRELIDMSYWMLLSKLDPQQILPVFEDSAELLNQAQVGYPFVNHT